MEISVFHRLSRVKSSKGWGAFLQEKSEIMIILANTQAVENFWGLFVGRRKGICLREKYGIKPWQTYTLTPTGAYKPKIFYRRRMPPIVLIPGLHRKKSCTPGPKLPFPPKIIILKIVSCFLGGLLWLIIRIREQKRLPSQKL